MREKARIKRILKKLERLWNKHPDLRFFQLLINFNLIPDTRYWNIEDTDIEEILDLIK